MSVEPDTVQSANRQIARAAGTVMAAFVLSNLIGLVRGILILRGFGTGAEMEAFNTANRLAETLVQPGGRRGAGFGLCSHIHRLSWRAKRQPGPGIWHLPLPIWSSSS